MPHELYIDTSCSTGLECDLVAKLSTKVLTLGRLLATGVEQPTDEDTDNMASAHQALLVARAALPDPCVVCPRDQITWQ